MAFQRMGNTELDIQRQVFSFKMLNDAFQIRFTVGISVVRDLDGREVMAGQFVGQFNRHRDKIETIAQRVFSSRQPEHNRLVALQREHFFS